MRHLCSVTAPDQGRARVLLREIKEMLGVPRSPATNLEHRSSTPASRSSCLAACRDYRTPTGSNTRLPRSSLADAATRVWEHWRLTILLNIQSSLSLRICLPKVFFVHHCDSGDHKIYPTASAKVLCNSNASGTSINSLNVAQSSADRRCNRCSPACTRSGREIVRHTSIFLSDEISRWSTHRLSALA